MWEVRYKACLVDTESYPLRSYRYIELSLVRAHMVDAATDYPWSSYASNAHGVANPLIHPHPSYLSLGTNEPERCAAYRAVVEQAVPSDELESLRLHPQRQHAFGTERFRTAIEAQLSRRAGHAKIGRPRKSWLPSESPT